VSGVLFSEAITILQPGADVSINIITATTNQQPNLAPVALKSCFVILIILAFRYEMISIRPLLALAHDRTLVVRGISFKSIFPLAGGDFYRSGARAFTGIVGSLYDRLDAAIRSSLRTSPVQ